MPRLILVALLVVGSAHAQGLIRDIHPSGDGSPAGFAAPRPGQAPGRVNAFAAHPAFAVIDGEAYFAADDGVHGVELWRTNGTEAGTELVVDANPGPDSGRPRQLTVYAGRLYFQALLGSTYCLFRSDGTAEGTTCWLPSRTDRPVSIHGVSGGILYLDNGGLWASDGEAAGAVTVQTDDIGVVPVNGGGLVALGEATLFSGGASGRGTVAGDRVQHFRTDGVTATALHPEQCCRTQRDASYLSESRIAFTDGRRLLFGCVWEQWDPAAGDHVSVGEELCISSASPDDVYAIDANPGPYTSHYLPFGLFGGRFFFHAFDGETSALRAFRPSDETVDRLPDPVSAEVYTDINATYRMDIAGDGDRAFVAASLAEDSGPGEPRVWRSDDDGTVPIWKPTRSTSKAIVAAGDGQVYVGALLHNGEGLQVFASDGVAEPALVAHHAQGGGTPDLTPYNGGVLYAARAPEGAADVGVELYGYGVTPRTVRQSVAAPGTVAFPVTRRGLPLPVEVAFASVGEPGRARITLLDRADVSLGDLPPSGPGALPTVVRFVPDGLGPFEAELTLTYTEDDLSRLGLSSEAALEVTTADGESVPVRRRDADANTLTVGPVTGAVDLVIWGETRPVGPAQAPAAGRIALAAPAPNPTTGRAVLTYALPAPVRRLRLAVHDALGREVRVLADGAHQAGSHTARLDLSTLPAGVYLVRLDAEGDTAAQRVTVIR